MRAEVPTPEELNDGAATVLADPRFRPPSPTWWQRALEWVLEQIELPNDTGWMGEVLGFVLLAAVLVAVAWVLKGIRKRRRAEASDVTVHTHVNVRTSRAEWLAKARQADEAGDWPQAVRCYFRATAAGLVEQAVVVAEPGATNREYIDDLRRDRPTVAPTFEDAAGLFESVYYGNAPASGTDGARQADLDGAVIGQVK